MYCQASDYMLQSAHFNQDSREICSSLQPPQP
jgi:hypothetical protein